MLIITQLQSSATWGTFDKKKTCTIAIHSKRDIQYTLSVLLDIFMCILNMIVSYIQKVETIGTLTDSGWAIKQVMHTIKHAGYWLDTTASQPMIFSAMVSIFWMDCSGSATIKLQPLHTSQKFSLRRFFKLLCYLLRTLDKANHMNYHSMF